MALDTTGFDIIQTPDGYFRHVSHEQRLLTSGWGSYASAERNADMYRDTEVALRNFRANYDTMYGKEAEPDVIPAP
jgi:hypothetical protein